VAGLNSFFGLDLTSGKRPSAYLCMNEKGEVTSFGFLLTDEEILEVIEGVKPNLVAIDSPLALPKGLCCLEEVCPCSTPSIGRSSERELARLGFPCYFTTKKSIIKRMVLRGISLSETLKAKGYEVIEVYPYASKVRLFKKRPPPKTTPQGLNFLKENLSPLLPSLPLSELTHDLADAAIAAYTAYLHYQGKTQTLGKEAEGVIVIPLS